MTTTLLLALLAAEPVEPEPELFERGGFHLLSIEATFGAALGGTFGFFSGDARVTPYKPLDPAVRAGGVAGIVGGTTAVGLLLAHYLRPSIGAAWTVGVMNVCAWSFSTGLAYDPAVQRERLAARAAFDPDWAIAAALSGVIGAAASALMLLPPDRSRVSVWTPILLAGATFTVTALYYFGGAAMGGPPGGVFVGNTTPFVPIIAMTVFRLLQGFLLPNLFLG